MESSGWLVSLLAWRASADLSIFPDPSPVGSRSGKDCPATVNPRPRHPIGDGAMRYPLPISSSIRYTFLSKSKPLPDYNLPWRSLQPRREWRADGREAGQMPDK